LIIAADGGARHCRLLGLSPDILIGDFDSLTEDEVQQFSATGAQVIHHPIRKDYTDLELALRHAHSLGIQEVTVLAALGARWDQTLANLLLPAAPDLKDLTIRLLDGSQEVVLLRGAGQIQLVGKPGDTVSLIPLGEHARGVTTQGLEYPLSDEPLFFGATRGLSNVMLESQATVSLAEGLLLCVVNHEG
jgi:thiamine pyrophosphokinase